MATPPADGGNVPGEGFYPDPSIPGYVRYWNGTAWVPGTSRPAPQGGEVMPFGPAEPDVAAGQGTAPQSVEETGPMFLDEVPPEGIRQEPATAWQADTSRQTGFGGEHAHRVSWGAPGQDPRQGPGHDPRQGPVHDPRQGPVHDPRQGPAHDPRQGPGHDPRQDPRVPNQSQPSANASDATGPHADPAGAAPADARMLGPGPDDGRPLSDGTVAIRAMRRGVTPGRGAGLGSGLTPGTDGPDASRRPGAGTPQRSAPHEPAPPVDSTVTLRALNAARRAKDEEAAEPVRQDRAEGTMTIRATKPGGSRSGSRKGSGTGAAAGQPQIPGQGQAQQAPQQQPFQPQQFQQQQPSRPFGSGGQADQPVMPWKPPADDPFLAMAQAQTAARPAGLGKRFAARLIDTVVLGAVVGAVAVPLVSKAQTHVDAKIDAAKQSGRTVTVWLLDSTTAGCLGAVLAALLILGVLYEALPTAKWGRTLGKKLCGLEVRDIESHQPPSFGAALRRWLVYGVLGLVVVGVVNVLWCLVDKPWRQCWHDKAARTFVAG
ncbi:RDD family protein [Streptomyces sp. NPDC088725]|uniref:RDD family protein n=1 Tax=Streptomyces sp. NPDC088725 TaxID=3365873 RepID=UPI003825C161